MHRRPTELVEILRSFPCHVGSRGPATSSWAIAGAPDAYTAGMDSSAALVAPAVVLLIAEGLHDLDHFRQGRGIEIPVIALGIVAYVAVLAVLVFASRRRPTAAPWAAVVGFGTALGFVLVHLLPDWGPLADGYPGLSLDAASWASVGVAIMAAAWLGGAGLVVTMYSRADGAPPS
jgi:hypothetical protein